ncbi:hypothetical protein D3C72_1647520 [compost metagenome]
MHTRGSAGDGAFLGDGLEDAELAEFHGKPFNKREHIRSFLFVFNEYIQPLAWKSDDQLRRTAMPPLIRLLACFLALVVAMGVGRFALTPLLPHLIAEGQVSRAGGGHRGRASQPAPAAPRRYPARSGGGALAAGHGHPGLHPAGHARAGPGRSTDRRALPGWYAAGDAVRTRTGPAGAPAQCRLADGGIRPGATAGAAAGGGEQPPEWRPAAGALCGGGRDCCWRVE